MNLHLVVMNTERHGRGLMHFHGALRGWLNYETALIAWFGDTALRFHVEVRLAAVTLCILDNHAIDSIDLAVSDTRLTIERVLIPRPAELAAGSRDFPNVRDEVGRFGRIRENAAGFDSFFEAQNRL